jgi:hypothetical protein
VYLAEDSFPADDSRHLVAGVREGVRVAVTGADEDATVQMWRRVTGVMPWAKAVTDEREAEIVVAIRPAREQAAALRTLAE